jgi:hypothetical protein
VGSIPSAGTITFNNLLGYSFLLVIVAARSPVSLTFLHSAESVYKETIGRRKTLTQTVVSLKCFGAVDIPTSEFDRIYQREHQPTAEELRT